MADSYSNDTIAALSTAPGAGAVAIVRISGVNTLAIADKTLKTFQNQAVPLTGNHERKMQLCRFVMPGTGETIDELMAVFFKGPRSFTGEDSLELHCHGGGFIINRILEGLMTVGARPAEPGEFTKRAFLNGKMDLTKAEGIRELVEAQSHQQWLAARHLATGRLKQAIESLRRDIIGAMAFLEARIDFPDEGDTQSVEMQHVRQRVDGVRLAVQRLADSFDSGRVAREGLMVAIIGAPNMGKSTLMNTLLGKERAIVTPLAGTTRDYIEERCLIRGRLIRLVDTAGVRETTEVVEQIGVNASRRLAQEADLIIYLLAVDSTERQRGDIEALKNELGDKRSLTVVSKADLGVPPWAVSHIAISCHSGQGLDNLEAAITACVDGYIGRIENETFITSARHAGHIRDALAALDRFTESMDAGLYEECLAFELQGAVRALHSIVGEVGSEDILDRIFSEFCVGK